MAKNEHAALDYIEALKGRYGSGPYLVLPEVRNQTGFGSQERRADAIVLSLWPSKGLDVHGYEVKASRADWLNELKQPEKADTFFRLCTRWSLLAMESSIVKKGEIPETWGYEVIMKNGKIKTIKAAPRRKVEYEKYLPFILSLVRSASHIPEKDELSKMLEEAKRVGHKNGLEAAKVKLAREYRTLDAREKGITYKEERQVQQWKEINEIKQKLYDSFGHELVGAIMDNGDLSAIVRQVQRVYSKYSKDVDIIRDLQNAQATGERLIAEMKSLEDKVRIWRKKDGKTDS